MEGELEDILSGKEVAIEAEPEAEQPEPQPETGEQPEQPAPEVTPTPEPEPEKVPLAALKAEREKRQRLEQQLRQYQQQQQQIDPQAFVQDPRVLVDFMEQRLTAERFNLSRSIVAATYPDYEELEELFVSEAEKNPALRAELLAAENPALFAYQTAKSLKTVREAQTGELEKRLRAEIEAKLRAEYEAKAKTTAIPPDLSGVRSAKAEVISDEPESLESILNSRKR